MFKKQLILMVLAGMISLTLQATSLPKHDFVARYATQKYGANIAQMTISLNRQDGKIIYSSKMRPKGLLALISNDKIDESSQLSSNKEGDIHVQEYIYTRKKKPEDNQHYHLTQQNDQSYEIKGQYHKKDITLNSPEKIWDNLSIQLALMSDASENAIINSKYQYTVIHKGILKHYEFEYLSKETLNLNGKNYQTLKIKRQHDPAGERSSYFWLATELDNLPIKIEQHKKSKLNLSIQMTEYKKI